MNDATAEWIHPMHVEALERGWGGEVSLPLMLKCMFPAAEADNPVVDEINEMVGDDSPTRVMAMDWLRYGELLRHELGWCDGTYPAYPEFRTGIGNIDE